MTTKYKSPSKTQSQNKSTQNQSTSQVTTKPMPAMPIDQIVQKQTRRNGNGPKKAGVLFSPGEKGYEIILAMKAEGLNIKRTVEQLLIWFWTEYQKQKQTK